MYKEVNNIIEKCSKQIGENNFSQKKLNAADHIEKKNSAGTNQIADCLSSQTNFSFSTFQLPINRSV